MGLPVNSGGNLNPQPKPGTLPSWDMCKADPVLGSTTRKTLLMRGVSRGSKIDLGILSSLLFIEMPN